MVSAPVNEGQNWIVCKAAGFISATITAPDLDGTKGTEFEHTSTSDRKENSQ
jgi:hypothetical protein